MGGQFFQVSLQDSFLVSNAAGDGTGELLKLSLVLLSSFQSSLALGEIYCLLEPKLPITREDRACCRHLLPATFRVPFD